ncbi:seryl-tRNA synthetase [Actinoalloteichus hoggarensis]|uniref:Serine--tRNA ligase n=1 Tax=Actinoalloteichus hoggarensis TaxID=1470176 RepID=A0A221W2F7_9PSEU|nr:serine--tRNA ligase [Actinoalloteichus hoggarensis]ASO19791.1 Serine--tRNA ligase [Actinoalloteichus hoggarensis]MBB5919502.1 seryl-tRNA synthetase [Actinoalloteichus hoggarensis]
MHDPRVLLDPATDAVRKLARRGYQLDLTRLETLLSARNSAIQRADEARAESKKVAASVGQAAKRGEDITALREHAKGLKGSIAEAEEEHQRLDAELTELMLGIPNLPDDRLPDGATDEFAELISTWGERPSFDFEPADHVDVGERLGIFDFPRATKLAGPRFVVLKGVGARLERALANFFLTLHTEEQGYTEFGLPALANRAALTGSGQLPKFQDDLFATGVADRELFLVPTAEVPLLNLHADEILATEELPFAYTAQTPCFRSEAGSYGRDTRGLIRMHQFSKVELVRFCEPEESDAQLRLMLSHAEECLRRLGLAYRVVALPAGDIGFSAQFTYDIEVWLPSQDRYREISSVSDCGVFQSRRAGIRTRTKDGRRGLAATLNGSGLAVGRTMVAILEQNQQADGSVRVPEALVPFLGTDVLRP